MALDYVYLAISTGYGHFVVDIIDAHDSDANRHWFELESAHHFSSIAL